MLPGLVVVMVGDTQGLVWELGQLRELGLEDRLLFVLPPPSREQPDGQRAQWAMICDATDLNRPRRLDVARVRAVVPHPDAPAITLESAGAGRFDYEAAVDAAAELVATPPRNSELPERLKRAPGQATASLWLAVAGFFTGGWLPVACVGLGVTALALGIPVGARPHRGRLRGTRRATAAIVIGTADVALGLAAVVLQLATR